MARLALSLALLAACGCSALPRATPLGPPLSERARIVWVGTRPPAAERARLLAHLDAAELVYRARFGGGPLDVREVELWDATRLPPALAGRTVRSGETLAGASWPAWGRIALPRRGRYPLGAAIHELHHLAGGDGDHRAASWRTADALDRALARESWGVWGW